MFSNHARSIYRELGIKDTAGDPIHTGACCREVYGMKKIVLIALAMLLFCTAAWAEASETTLPGSNGRPESIYGKYAFKKQVYMNPLSSFLALEGFHEYYTFSEDTFVITDQNGSQRSMKISYEPSPVDEALFRDCFMMEGFGIPDITAYQERCQYTISDTSCNALYRLYLLDNEIWLAQVHWDSANAKKSEYIWSIYQLERFEGEIPLTVFISGTLDGVKDFSELQADFHSGYDQDACYNITPDSFGEDTMYSVFKYDTSCASFLLFEGKVYTLGEWFGGFGVTSMALADLNEDGLQELYFTYSFGSGIHRSHIAYFDPVLKKVVPIDYTHLDKDMTVAASATGGLSLHDAGFPMMDSFVQFEMKSIGHIADIVYEGGQICLKPVPQE